LNLHVFRDYESIVKFLIVGAAGFVLETAVLFIFHGVMGVNLFISKALAVESAIIMVFYLNDGFTFKQFKSKTYALLRTNIVRSGGILLSFTGLYLGVSMGIHYLLANILGVIMATGFNYYFERIVTWDSV